jgi:hypothetical protein
MNGREYFHESVVKDIIDIITDLKDFDEVQFINNVNNKRSFKSITSATKDLILTFPVMVSTDIEPDNAIMIAKAQEKKMASLLHILFTAISVDCNEDVYDYVRKFHANVGSMGGTLDSYSDAFDKLATTFGESYDATLKIDHAVLETVLEELKESNYTLPDNVNESSLESYKIVPGYRTGYDDMIIHEEPRYTKVGNLRDARASLASYFDDPNTVTYADVRDALNAGKIDQDTADIFMHNISTLDGANMGGLPSGSGNYSYSTSSTSSRINTMDDDEKQLSKIVSDWENGVTDHNNKDAEKQYNSAKQQLERYEKARHTSFEKIQTDNKKANNINKKELGSLDAAKYMESITKAHNAVVLNNEYKKANELQPTMMVINFMKKDKNDEGYINTAVIGIKCKIYPITSADIVNRISGKLKDKNFLTNFVRATTNEIAFFRDFLFAVDQAKFDAKSYGKNASSNKLWKVLERRSVKSRFRRSLKMYNDATAISTLVMSENDAEYLKKVDNIDILEVAKARKIMDEYNFMCLVVANQSTEVASFLYDTGDDTYEMIPFSGLEREASDNSYKKMVNLLSKVSR